MERIFANCVMVYFWKLSFFHGKRCVVVWTQMGQATIWAIFTETHLVTLVVTLFLQPNPSIETCCTNRCGFLFYARSLKTGLSIWSCKYFCQKIEQFCLKISVSRKLPNFYIDITHFILNCHHQRAPLLGSIKLTQSAISNKNIFIVSFVYM
jgi:hypothetical protein